MADFKIALNIVLNNEGGYVNDYRDKGGETYRGISRKHHPNWPGWRVLDDSFLSSHYISIFSRDFNQKNHWLAQFTGDTNLNVLVERFYRDTFWDKIHGDEINDQKIATAIFDTAVILGVFRAVRFAQQVLNAIRLGQLELEEDGVMGDKTLAVLNFRTSTGKGVEFLTRYIERRKQHHLDRTEKDPTQQCFLKGWLARAERLEV